MVKHGKTLLIFPRFDISNKDLAEVWSGSTARSMPRHGVARPASRGWVKNGDFGHGDFGKKTGILGGQMRDLREFHL